MLGAIVMNWSSRWLAVASTVLLILSMGRAQAADLRMQVRGELGIDPEGKVYATDISTILTPDVKALVEKTVRGWQFEPIVHGGKAVYAKTGMQLDLLARQVDAGYRLQVENVRFMYGDRKPLRMVPPQYPMDALREHISGDVLMAIRIDAQGRVVDAAAIQFSLPYRDASEKQIQRWGKHFEKAAVAAVKGWAYEAAKPDMGQEAEMTQIVPISFRTSSDRDVTSSVDGWQPAPDRVYKPIPWLTADQQKFDATGLKQGESLAVGTQQPTLKSPVVGAQL